MKEEIVNLVHVYNGVVCGMEVFKNQDLDKAYNLFKQWILELEEISDEYLDNIVHDGIYEYDGHDIFLYWNALDYGDNIVIEFTSDELVWLKRAIREEYVANDKELILLKNLLEKVNHGIQKINKVSDSEICR